VEDAAGMAAAALKEAIGLAGAGADGAAGAAVFCFAISANAFRMLEVSGAAGCCGTPSGFTLGAGEPSGVCDSTANEMLDGIGRKQDGAHECDDDNGPSAIDLLAFNFSLKELSMGAGNVPPRSQISTSFLIFS
jgi:hypothetical protein